MRIVILILAFVWGSMIGPLSGFFLATYLLFLTSILNGKFFIALTKIGEYIKKG